MQRNKWFRLAEACIGIGIGAAIAAPIEFAVLAASGHQSHADEISQVCPPLGNPPGPGLDGDRVSLAHGGLRICDGSTGKWETPEVRAEHVRQRVIAMPWTVR